MKTVSDECFYNYVLLDTTRPGVFNYGRGLVFEFEPFYVGKGCGGRKYAHFTPQALRGDSKKVKRIKRIKRQTGEWPAVVIKKRDVTECESFRCEYKLIHLIGRKSHDEGPLLNLTSGGAGSSGRKDSEATVLKRVTSYKEYLSTASTKELSVRWDNISKAHQAMSAEDYTRFVSKCKASNVSHTDATRAKMSESGKLRFAAMTAKEQRAHARKMSLALTKMHQGLTSEERSDRIRKGHLVKDHESINAKISQKALAQHAARTPEQRAAIAYKISQSLLRRNAENRQLLAA